MNINDVLNQSRNGADRIIRYSPFFPRFLISNGVEELAEAAGCYWLLDMLAAELAPKLTQAIADGKMATGLLEMAVEGGKASITFSIRDGVPPMWQRDVSYTDFPEGHWALFEIGAHSWTADGRPVNLLCHLISEH